jgi:hypothetical protein
MLDDRWEAWKKVGALRQAMVRPARLAVARAISAGKLPRLDGAILCVDCGKPATEYDHREYARPLDVQPVCHSCNLRRGPASDIAHLCYHFSPVLAPRQPPRRFRAVLAAARLREHARLSNTQQEHPS